MIKRGMISERIRGAIAFRISNLDRGLVTVHCHDSLAAILSFTAKKRPNTNENAGESTAFLCQDALHVSYVKRSSDLGE